MPKPKPVKEEWPELYELAEEIAREVAMKINDRAPRVNTRKPMPYRCQMVLEMLIGILEDKV